MTKKLIITITILLMLIISMFGAVCYADYSSSEFLYNITNNNVTSKSISSDNQNSAINNLYTNGYRSVISRYSQQTMHVKYTFYTMKILYQYRFTSGGSLNEFLNYINNIEFEIQQNASNSLYATNLNYSNLSHSYSYSSYSDVIEFYYNLTGTLEFDMPMTNTQITEPSSASDLRFNSLELYFLDPYFNVGNHTYYIDRIYLVRQNEFNYRVDYYFNDTLNNIDGFYLFNEISPYSTNNNFNNNYSFSTNSNVIFNNSTTNINGSGTFSCNTILVNTIENSKVSHCSYESQYLSNLPSYGFTFSNGDELFLDIATFTPIIFSKNEFFIQSNSNNFEPLKLNYYDAQWYELHYQLANAFIFLITELPIISNITNAVYSTINVIQTAFNTLSEFSAFGYIFAFGMFALVFGILIKLFLGD